MDIKTLKNDLTYAVKTLQKDGKELVIHFRDELTLESDRYLLNSSTFDLLQALIVVKGWKPTKEHLLAVSSNWVEATHGYSETAYLFQLLHNEASISLDEWSLMEEGFFGVILASTDPFYLLGVSLRKKFPTKEMSERKTKPSFYHHPISTITKRFIVQTNGKAKIVEVECQEVQAASPTYQLLSPASIWTKGKDGGLLFPLVPFDQVFTTIEEAKKRAEDSIREKMVLDVSKGRMAAVDEALIEKMARAVQVLSLVEQ